MLKESLYNADPFCRKASLFKNHQVQNDAKNCLVCQAKLNLFCNWTHIDIFCNSQFFSSKEKFLNDYSKYDILGPSVCQLCCKRQIHTKIHTKIYFLWQWTFAINPFVNKFLCFATYGCCHPLYEIHIPLCKKIYIASFCIKLGNHICNWKSKNFMWLFWDNLSVENPLFLESNKMSFCVRLSID